MSLTAADVAEIMRLVEQSSFDELTLEMGGVKLALRRGAAVAGGAISSNTESSSAARASATTSSATAAAATPPAAPTRAAAHAPPANPNEHDVPSPLLGTFYRAPKPGAAPFVEVGAAVEEDTIVGIIEVMKLMNTVRAGVRGTVTAIFPGDGTLVEYDQPLLRVRKTG